MGLPETKAIHLWEDDPDDANKVTIGIDPGVHTGVACWNIQEKRFVSIKSTTIIEAMDFLNNCPYIIENIMCLPMHSIQQRVNPF